MNNIILLQLFATQPALALSLDIPLYDELFLSCDIKYVVINNIITEEGKIFL
ncbi:MAG: hypothetical protein ACP6IY_06720 [Promethearchaeia archaeon]